MKRSQIQSLQGVWAKQLQQLSGFAEYNHLCILMLNVSFLLQRGGYWFGYSRKLAVVLVYGVFGPIHVERHAVFPDDRISLGYTVATL